MQTWKLTINYAANGNSRNRWTNVLHFQSAAALNSAAIIEPISHLIATIRANLLDKYSITSYTISDPTKRASGYDPALVRTEPVGQAGQKQVGAQQAEVNEVVIKLVGSAGTGRPAHISLRGMLFDSEVVGGTGGEPVAVGQIVGIDGVVTGFNTLDEEGLMLRSYSKRKSGAITDVAIQSWAYVGVGAKKTTRAGKRKPPTTAGGLLDAGKELLDNLARFQAGSSLVKTLAPGTVAKLGELLPKLGAAGDALPELLALL